MYFFIFILFFISISVSKQCSATSDLGLHCLPMSEKRDDRLIWVSNISIVLKLASENAPEWIIFSSVMKRQNMFLPIISTAFVVKCAAKIWKSDKE